MVYQGSKAKLRKYILPILLLNIICLQIFNVFGAKKEWYYRNLTEKKGML